VSGTLQEYRARNYIPKTAVNEGKALPLNFFGNKAPHVGIHNQEGIP